MVEYVYRCDRCRKQTKTPIRIYGCMIEKETNRVIPEADPPKRELCPDCYSAVQRFIEAGTTEDEEQEERKKKEEKEEARKKAEEDTAKAVAKKTRDRIVLLYRKGSEMEEIETLTGVPIAIISRVIDQEGLGKDRYKGKAVPDSGSAPVANIDMKQGRVKGA